MCIISNWSYFVLLEFLILFFPCSLLFRGQFLKGQLSNTLGQNILLLSPKEGINMIVTMGVSLMLSVSTLAARLCA